MKVVRSVLWPAGFAVGLVAEWAAYGFRDPSRWIPDLLVGWTLIASGLVARRGRPDSRIGSLLVLTGLTWFVGNFAGSGVPFIAWVARHGIYLHRGPFVQALLTYPTGRARSRADRVAVAVGYLAAVLEPIWADERLTIVVATLLVGYAIGRYLRSVAADRRVQRLSVWVTGVFAATIAGDAAARLAVPGDLVEELSVRMYQVVVSGAAVALTVGLLTRMGERPTVANLVVEVGEERSDRLRESLARTLGDRHLEVGYWSPDTQGYIDSAGRPLKLPTATADRATTLIGPPALPIGVIIHHPSLLDDPSLVESIATAARLASVNARLQAEVRAQVFALEASRRRIVTAGDEQQRQLESRLRQGAERRLGDLASRLETTRRRSGDPAAATLLDKVGEDLADTLDELRVLASGLHPRLLAERGLGPALEAVAARSATPTTVVVTVARLPAELEAAAYFVCCEALANVDKHAVAASASVAVSTVRTMVHIEVTDNGQGGADLAAGSGLLNLTDRVQALGGTVEISSAPSAGTRLVAELPLGDKPPD